MNRRAYIYFVLTFLLGTVVGGAGTFFYAWNSGQWHRHFDKQHMIHHLKRELNLSDTQVQQVGQIMDDSMKKYHALRKQVGPQFAAIREEGRSRIRQILTPEQIPKFDKIVRRFEEERNRKGAP